MSRVWNNYKHRCTLWLALNWSTRNVQKVTQESSQDKLAASSSQLRDLLEALHDSVPPLSPRDYHTLLRGRSPERLNALSKQASDAVLELFGFSLVLGPSRLTGGGVGVFVERGCVRKGQLVALYPGTVYLPFEPILLQSLRNSYILRCLDGVLVDGKNRGISMVIFKSCAFRDVVGPFMSCDITWLKTKRINPLAIGQWVNNHTRENAANVDYVEVDLPPDVPLEWRRFIPNVYYNLNMDAKNALRMVGLIATADIQSGQELYSSYLTIVES
eukprot:Em0011g262a